MASGHVNRTYRPNTWQHRPSLQREESPCQPGAVHTWQIASFRHAAGFGRYRGMAHPGHESLSAYFPASPTLRFPNNILSLIRSFARHPALLSREMKVTVQPGGF
jgi:hypothetical protein